MPEKPDTKPNSDLCPSGIEGLDVILAGGFPKNRVYLVQGEPGTGKTTLAIGFLLEGIKRKEKCLYITFSETREELMAVAKSHEWDLSELDLFELSALEEQLKPEAQTTIFHPAEVELNRTMQVVLAEIERVKPTRVVFDSLSEMRLLAETPLRYRRQMLALKTFFSGRNSTVLLLDDLTTSKEDLHVQSIVHGVFALEKTQPEFGSERRRINVVKLRGVDFIGGKHDYVIRRGGTVIFPRIVPVDNYQMLKNKPISSGLGELDALLDGGLDRGTSNLFMGPAGSGKSTLSTQYVFSCAEKGEKIGIFLFEENISTFLSRAAALKMDLRPHIDSGKIKIRKIDPAELSPGEFSSMIQNAVELEKVSVILIDSLNGYIHAMPERDFLILQLHELVAYLSHHGVLTLMVLAQQGLMGSMQTPVDLTYLTDTLIITRFFEAAGAVKKAISVVKKRSGNHEDTIREFKIQKTGLWVGPPLANFQGVLSGIPRLVSKEVEPPLK